VQEIGKAFAEHPSYRYKPIGIFKNMKPSDLLSGNVPMAWPFRNKPSLKALLAVILAGTLSASGQVYHALFALDHEDALEAGYHQTSGYMALKVSSSGFSARIWLDGDRISASGKLVSGKIQAEVSRDRFEKSPITLDLDFSGNREQVFGTALVDGGESDLSGFRRDTSKGNPGIYTMLIPGSDDAGVAPPGFGIARVVIGFNRTVRFRGHSPDGQKFGSLRVHVSTAGHFPVFAPMYHGNREVIRNGSPVTVKTWSGSMFGWLTVSSGAPEGVIVHVKSELANGNFYPEGFTLLSEVAASPYTRPASGVQPLVMETGTLLLSDGDLGSAISIPVTFGTNRLAHGLFPTVPNGYELRASVAPSTGLLRGRFMHPDIETLVEFRGAVLQDQNIAGGFFLGASETGKVRLQPDN
jgi:hypothetical protein